MKVILLEDVPRIGRKFEVKEVSAGYARNFLFPNKLAETATPGAMKKLEAAQAEHNREEQELLKRLREIAQKIEGTTLVFELKTDKAGSVFGSVNKEGVLRALRDHGLITKERVDVELKYPIKTPGDHAVPIDLKKGVTATLKISIRAAG